MHSPSPSSGAARGRIGVLAAPLLPTPATYILMNGTARAAILFITESEGMGADWPADLLRRLYDLTRTEATVALGIADGLSIDEIAARGSVERETVRTQLKAVFAKTSTHRQSGLASQLAGLPKFPRRNRRRDA